jgi:hypothetical protein
VCVVLKEGWVWDLAVLFGGRGSATRDEGGFKGGFEYGILTRRPGSSVVLFGSV